MIMETLETLSLIFACLTVTLGTFYIIKIKRQLNSVEKAFKQACGEIHKLQNPEFSIQIDGKDLFCYASKEMDN